MPKKPKDSEVGKALLWLEGDVAIDNTKQIVENIRAEELLKEVPNDETVNAVAIILKHLDEIRARHLEKMPKILKEN